MNIKSFRTKIAMAMMAVLTIVLTAALFLSLRTSRRTLDHSIEDLFAKQTEYFRLVQSNRLNQIKELCDKLSRSVRLFAALDSMEHDFIYQLVDDEFQIRGTADKRKPEFFLVLDYEGKVIPRDQRKDVSSEETNLYKQLEEQFLGIVEEQHQALVYLSVVRSDGVVELEEVVLTRIIDPISGEQVGGLAAGFPTEISGEAGLFFDGAIYHTQFEESEKRRLLIQLEELLLEEKPLASGVDIDLAGTSYRVSLKEIASDSLAGKSAYQIGFYSLEQAHEDQLRLLYQFSFFALLSLFVGFVLSLILSRGLTQPILKLVDAAEKVKKGNLDTRVPVSSHDEVGLLSQTFNDMTTQMKQDRDELAEYSQNLEKMVEQRTEELSDANRTIQAMIDSLDQGFFIISKRGVIIPIYSRVCHELLECEPGGMFFWEVVGGDSQELQSWVGMLFDEPVPFKDIAALGPMTREHSEGRYIALDYHPIRNEDSNIEEIVVVATDKTEEQNALRVAEQERYYTKMILSLVKNKNQLLHFVQEARKLIEVLHGEVEKEQPDTTLLIRHFHTLKGGSSTFWMDTIVSLAHEAEGLLNNDWSKTSKAVKEKVREIDNALESFLKEHMPVLGKAAIDGKPRVEVKKEDIDRFYEQLKDSTLSESFLRLFVSQPIEYCFSHFDNVLQPIASKLGKELKPIVFEGGDTRIVVEPYSELFAAMIHAARNALDHGIEMPQERQQIDKDSAGQIALSFAERDETLIIEMSDDGRGVSPEKIRAKLRELGLDDEAKQDDEQIIQYVFHSGLSTKDEVTDLSGRGVGMEAIKAAAMALGGDVWMESRQGVGTTLSVTVPRKVL